MSDQTEGQVEATEAPEGLEATPEVTETPVTETPVEATETQAEETPKPAAPSKALLGRISKLTAERQAQATRIAELEAQIARGAQTPPEGAPPQGQRTPEQYQADVAQAAKLQAEQQRFMDKCNEIYFSAKA